MLAETKGEPRPPDSLYSALPQAVVGGCQEEDSREIKKATSAGAWVAQLVKRPTLDFGLSS